MAHQTALKKDGLCHGANSPALEARSRNEKRPAYARCMGQLSEKPTPYPQKTRQFVSFYRQ
ncbi:MAG: hypothetical protein AAFV92_09950, partial [Pseudomonadota bacterium]